MNFINLLENFKDYVQGKPIFFATSKKDFTSNELKEIKEWPGVRFIYIASKSPTLYVFPGNLLHMFASAKLGINYMKPHERTKPVFFGEANVTNGNIFYTDSFDLKDLFRLQRSQVKDLINGANKQISMLANGNWSLALKYIRGLNKTIKQLKDKNESLKKE